MNNFYAHGKLLLTGEYLVLEGATALALPVRFGQSFSAVPSSDKKLTWHASQPDGKWFDAVFTLPGLEIVTTTDASLASRLKDILLSVRIISPDFLSSDQGFIVKTVLGFHPQYGLGSSSTLIANLGRWANVDPYLLQKITFGGSGFDIACALSGKPLFYRLLNEKHEVEKVHFKPKFYDKIFYVYLGNKKKSKESIAEYRATASFDHNKIDRISQISHQIVSAENIEEFEILIHEHEEIMSAVLKQKPVKKCLFDNYEGAVKSLGAWGGDFILMTSSAGKGKLKDFLSKKGLKIIYGYDELILD